MNAAGFFFAFLSAVFFAWPLVTRTVSVQSVTLSLWVVLFAIPVLLFAAWFKKGLAPPQGRDLVLIAIGGVMLGCGMVVFGKLTSTSSWPISISAPSYTVMATLLFVVVGVLVYREQFTTTRGIGVTLAIAAIWCLR